MISLIVPTYNRSVFLRHSLPTFMQQSLSHDCYEIIIVDNNSSDDTRQVIYDLMSRVPVLWSYVFEPQQGLHYARNTGIKNASGSIIVFGDDDIQASYDWLKTIHDEFEQHPKTGLMGGKIVPLWSHTPPEWIFDYGSPKVHGIFAYLDYGDERRVLSHEYVFGCNLALRASLAHRIGGSAPDVYPGKLKQFSGRGENHLIDGVRALGYDVIYCPQAVVHHYAQAERISHDYFLERNERFAIEHVFLCLNRYGYLRGIAHLMRFAVGKLSQAYVIQFKNMIYRMIKRSLVPLNKVDPVFFVRMEKMYGYAVVRQMIRVMFNVSLYRSIMRNNYLS